MNFKTNKENMLFVVTGDLEIYIIPKDKINNRTTITLGEDYKKYKVKAK